MKREMLRKILCGALAASLVLSLAGCKPSEKGSVSGASAVSETPVGSSKPEQGEIPQLGVADTDYNGFQYLTKEILTAGPEGQEEDGKGEKRSLAVFIPQDEYSSVQSSRARGQKMGLALTVDLDPILRYQAEDYTPAENLDEYLSSMYDPEYTIYDSVTVGKAEEDSAGKSAKAVVTYCYYSSFDDEMIPFYVTYYLTELDGGLYAMVDAEIDGENATGKLPGLLDEIEAFYGFRPEWDAAAAEKLASEAKAKGPHKSKENPGGESSIAEPALEDVPAAKNADGTFTASGITFRLPEGWDIDDSDGEQSSFAPDGDAAFAGYAILVMRQYNGASAADLEVFKSNPEVLEAMLKAYMENAQGDGDDSADMNFKVCETAPFGVAIKMDMVQDEGVVNAYFIFDEQGYLYILMAADTEDGKPAAQALETVFGSAKLN